VAKLLFAAVLTLALAAAAAPTKAQVLVDFEAFPDRSILSTQLQGQGIATLNGAVVVDCSLPTSDQVCTNARSGSKVLVPSGFELQNDPLVIEFLSPQSWAELFVRADASAIPQSVTLTAFDADGVVWTSYLSDIASFGPALRVQGGVSEAPIITRIELTSSWFNFFHIDDLQFAGDGTPGGDTTSPELTIEEPGDGAIVSLALEDNGVVDVRATASDAGLATVSGFAEHDATGTVNPFDFCGTAFSPLCPVGTTLDRTVSFFSAGNEGAYTLFVEACDGSGNCTSFLQSFTLDLPVPPPPQEADVWVMGIEYNQGYQDHVFTDLGSPTRIGSIPFSCGSDACPDSRFAAPVIPGRPMTVRAYVGVRDGGPENVPVRGVLHFSNCQVGSAFRRDFVAIENPSCRNHIGTSMPCEREIDAHPSLGRLGLNTNTDYDIDLVAMRTDLSSTLNFVVPEASTSLIRESGCMSLDVEVEFAAPGFVDPNEANNEFRFAMENVSDPNPLAIDQVRIAMPAGVAPSAPLAAQAMDDMLRTTVDYDEVMVESDSTMFWDGAPLSIGVDPVVINIDQCNSLWIELFLAFGLDPRRTVVGLYPDGTTLTGCGGLGWRVPRPIPFFRERDDYLGGIAIARPSATATLAQEVYHADLDRRHVSNLHGEGSGCGLTGTAADIVGAIFNVDPDCFHEAAHPHGEIGTYPAALVRIGAPPGPGLFDGGTVYGNVGNMGIEMEFTGGNWELTLYDPCPTPLVDRAAPLDAISQRWIDSPTDTGYDCQIADGSRPHDVLSYGTNRWFGLQLNPFIKSTFDRSARAIYTRGSWVGDASELHHPPHEHADANGAAAPRSRNVGAESTVARVPRKRPKTLPNTGLQFSGFVTEDGDVGFAPLTLPLGAVEPLLPKKQKLKLPIELRVEDAEGEVGRAPVAVMITPPHPQSLIFFAGGLPEGLSPEIIRLILGDEEIASVEASPNAPDLQLLSPVGGEMWQRFTTESVSWSVSDADGDDVRITVRFSPDNGETWSPLGVLDGTAGLLDVDTTTLPVTSQALVSVVASDGMRVVEERSAAPFTIAGFCADESNCDDGDACTVDTCSAGECIPAPMGGFDGMRCELDKLLDPTLCGVDPLHPKLEKQIGKKVAKAQKALTKGETATTEKKRAKALRKVDKQLEVIARKATKSATQERVSWFCGHAVEQRARAKQRLLLELGV